MKKSLLMIAFAFVFLIELKAQKSRDVEEVETSNSANEYIPILGSNFAYGHGDNITASVSYLSGDDLALTSLLVHFGFGKTFSLSVGSANIDVINPELIYISPELSLPLTSELTLGVQLRTGISDEFDNFVMAPTAMISYGQPLKNITFGYSPLLDDENFESMALGDLNYINGSIKVEGRMPINNELAVVSKNDFVLDDFSSIIGRAGVEYRSKNISFYTMVHHLRFTFFNETESQTNLVAGFAYAFTK